LDKICGASHDLFSHTKAPRRKLLMGTIAREEENTNLLEGKSSRKKKMRIGLEKEVTLRSKILIHFIKGKISLTLVEVILIIPRELEYLEGFVKLARRHKNEDNKSTSISTMTPNLPIMCKINITKITKLRQFICWWGSITSLLRVWWILEH